MEKQQQNKVFSWGLGADGRLGTGKEDTQKTPVQTFSNVKQAYCGAVINQKSEIMVFGSNKKKQLSGEVKDDKIVVPHRMNSKVSFQSLAMGYWHFLALDTQGIVYSHGYSSHGALGNGREAPCLTRVSREGNLFKSVYAGREVSMAVQQGGSLWGCGRENMNGKEKDSKELHLIGSMEGRQVKTVGLGYSHVAVVTEEGELFTWGDNTFGQLGGGKKRKEAQRVEGLTGVVNVSCSIGEQYGQTGCVNANGVGYLWGSNYKYKLGHTDINMDTKQDSQAIQAVIVSQPKILSFFQKQGILLKEVISGGIHSAALDQEGCLWTFGCGSDGRLGHEAMKSARYLYKEKEPVLVEFPTKVRVVSVSTGYYHMTCLAEAL